MYRIINRIEMGFLNHTELWHSLLEIFESANDHIGIVHTNGRKYAVTHDLTREFTNTPNAVFYKCAVLLDTDSFIHDRSTGLGSHGLYFLANTKTGVFVQKDIRGYSEEIRMSETNGDLPKYSYKAIELTPGDVYDAIRPAFNTIHKNGPKKSFAYELGANQRIMMLNYVKINISDYDKRSKKDLKKTFETAWKKTHIR